MEQAVADAGVERFQSEELARAVCAALRRALGESTVDVVVQGPRAALWTAEAGRAGLRVTDAAAARGSDALPVVLACSPGVVRPETVDELVGHAAAVIFPSEPSASAVPDPASWVPSFVGHAWRFSDVIRPVLWDDPRLRPDVKEGWLCFVAPGELPQLAASPPLRLLHPDRIVESTAAVHAELELLREQFLERLQPLAHRRELDVARQRLADAAETIDSQRQQLAALEARVAANERRLVQLMEQQLGLGGPLVAPAAAPVGPASLRRRLLDRLTGQPPARLAATPATPTVSPAVVALFDANSYVAEHPDAAEHPLTHYLTKGEALGYRPNPWFDPLFYRERYPDVARAGVGALVHFADYGGAEGRRASAEFDTEWYVATYPEVRRSGLNPLLHYLAVGAALGHRTRAQALPGEEQR